MDCLYSRKFPLGIHDLFPAPSCRSSYLDTLLDHIQPFIQQNLPKTYYVPRSLLGEYKDEQDSVPALQEQSSGQINMYWVNVTQFTVATSQQRKNKGGHYAKTPGRWLITWGELREAGDGPVLQEGKVLAKKWKQIKVKTWKDLLSHAKALKLHPKGMEETLKDLNRAGYGQTCVLNDHPVAWANDGLNEDQKG